LLGTKAEATLPFPYQNPGDDPPLVGIHRCDPSRGMPSRMGDRLKTHSPETTEAKQKDCPSLGARECVFPDDLDFLRFSSHGERRSPYVWAIAQSLVTPLRALPGTDVVDLHVGPLVGRSRILAVQREVRQDEQGMAELC
jgi:hypothetical protein